MGLQLQWTAAEAKTAHRKTNRQSQFKNLKPNNRQTQENKEHTMFEFYSELTMRQ